VSLATGSEEDSLSRGIRNIYENHFFKNENEIYILDIQINTLRRIIRKIQRLDGVSNEQRNAYLQKIAE
jgi:tmRNA-binding protein